MMTLVVRGVAILGLAYLIGACTRVGHIQRAAPVQTITYPAPHTVVATCAQQRLRGKLQYGAYDRMVVYDSVRALSAEGVTHYSVTFGRAGERGGYAELRLLAGQSAEVQQGPQRSAGPVAPPAPGQPAMTETVKKRLWVPVQECAAAANPA